MLLNNNINILIISGTGTYSGRLSGERNKEQEERLGYLFKNASMTLSESGISFSYTI